MITSSLQDSLSVTPEAILRRLDWQVIRRLDGLLQGDYRTLFYGEGIDFADLRIYQPGDDIRHIDWNVTARLNSAYVRHYHEDRDLTTWFLLDISQSMGYGPTGRTKRQLLIELAATLSRLVTRNGNRVGAILYASKVERVIPPLGTQQQVLRIIHELLKSSSPSGGPETDLAVLLEGAHNALKRRSLIFLISDFFSVPGWEKPLMLLNQRHEVVALRIFDQREVEIPDVGMVYVEDAETAEQLYLDTTDPQFLRRFNAAVARREAQIESAMQRAGVDLFAISTEDDLVRKLVRMAHLRKYRRR